MVATNTNPPDADSLVGAARVPAYIVTERTSHLPAEERDAIRWFHAHYFKQNLSLNSAGRKIGYDASTVCRIFRGNYRGANAEVVKKILAYQEQVLASERRTLTPFIKASLFSEIKEYCDLARTYRKIVILYGESQIGKTANVSQIEREDLNGNTKKVEIPSGAGLCAFKKVTAGACGVGAKQVTANADLNIVRYFRERPESLLIIDEASRIGGKKEYGGGSFRILEYIRWLYDNGQMGTVLVATPQLRETLAIDEHAKYLNQSHRRVLLVAQLPDLPSRADLNIYSANYGLPPATGDARAVEKAIIAKAGVGVWLTYMAMGQRRALKDGDSQMTWDHVLNAVAWVKSVGKVERRFANNTTD